MVDSPLIVLCYVYVYTANTQRMLNVGTVNRAQVNDFI